MRVFRGTARPSFLLRSSLRRIAGKPWTVPAKYRQYLWVVGFFFPFCFSRANIMFCVAVLFSEISSLSMSLTVLNSLLTGLVARKHNFKQ